MQTDRCGVSEPGGWRTACLPYLRESALKGALFVFVAPECVAPQEVCTQARASAAVSVSGDTETTCSTP